MTSGKGRECLTFLLLGLTEGGRVGFIPEKGELESDSLLGLGIIERISERMHFSRYK